MALTERTDTIGPILSDGTPVIDLIDVENKAVSLRLFSDPEVYRYEQQYLFARSWQIVAHETEVQNAGDFVLRSIAQDSVIVCRDRDGAISVLLNVCPHRGMQVCRSEEGNATSFRCPYHGWVFGREGSMLGAPFEREMYGDRLEKTRLGLRRARVETYAGIVFANWDPTAPGLEEFLGEYRWYLDTIFKRSKDGIECVGAPQRFVIRSNWKAPSEQFNGADGYHAATLHGQLWEPMVAPDNVQALIELKRNMLDCVDIGSPMGHGLRCVPGVDTEFRVGVKTTKSDGRAPIEILQENLPQYLPAELVPELAETMTEGQLRALVSYPPNPGGLFPNVGFLHLNLRTHVPLGLDTFEMRNWVFVEKKASPEHKATVKRQMLAGFGTSGMIEQDDSEAWPAMQRAAKGYIGSQSTMKYQAFVGHNPPEDWEGGAYVYKGFSKDDSAWNFWLRYRDYMSGRPW